MEFEDNSEEVKAAMQVDLVAFLYEAAGELESQYRKNTRVDTGKTKGGISYQVDEERLEAVIGGDSMNHIWEEFGTGEYALGDNGRKGGWAYTDPVSGERHFTRGKRPSQALQKAYDERKDAIIAEAARRLKDWR